MKLLNNQNFWGPQTAQNVLVNKYPPPYADTQRPCLPCQLSTINQIYSDHIVTSSLDKWRLFMCLSPLRGPCDGSGQLRSSCHPFQCLPFYDILSTLLSDAVRVVYIVFDSVCAQSWRNSVSSQKAHSCHQFILHVSDSPPRALKQCPKY